MRTTMDRIWRRVEQVRRTIHLLFGLLFVIAGVWVLVFEDLGLGLAALLLGAGGVVVSLRRLAALRHC
jgi:hypothetical protein